jgi:nucleoside-diphosphate-sugar epimerase
MHTMSLTAFVSGASGFVGSNLVRALHSRGWAVHVLARPTSSLDEIDAVPVTVHRGDVTDSDSIMKAIPEGVDAVFHVAASTNFWSKNNAGQDRVNIEGTRNMTEAAMARGARRFIHTSSFVTWGFGNKAINEESERSGSSDWINYVRSKHRAEEAVLEAAKKHRLDVVILNPAHILGPGDLHNWSRMIRMANQGKLFAAPPGGGNFCDVREIALAHIQGFHSGRSGQKYLLGGEYSAFVDVVRTTGRILGKRVPRTAAPAWIMKTWGHVNNAAAMITGREPDITPESAAMVSYRMDCDSAKAREELGYRFTPISTLIQDTVDWMKMKGLLQ